MKGHLKERSPGHWAIVIDVPDPATGKRRRKWHSFTGGKREAQVECARLISEIKGGVYLEPHKTTLAKFLDRWLEHEAPNVSPKTLERYKELATKTIVPLIGDVIISKLKAERIDGAMAKALQSGRRDGKGGLSPRTVHHMRRVLVKALNQAVTWEMLAKNPALATKAPKVERKQMTSYDVAQTATLLNAIRPTRIYIPVVLAAMCGLRRGEIIALQWKHVDLDGKSLSIVRSAEQTTTGVRYKEPKSGRARTVALSATVIDDLRRHRARLAEEQLRLGIRIDEESFVVAQADGRPIQPRSLTHEWVRIVTDTDLPRIRFHDLRHTHASQLLAAGVHPKIASERLGHSSIGITLDLYSHVMPGMQADAAEQVDAAIQRALKATDKSVG
ncbi:integrase family protein [Mesorhizobium loti]|nr:integrase family protein [Mesorhizobium loti]